MLVFGNTGSPVLFKVGLLAAVLPDTRESSEFLIPEKANKLSRHALVMHDT